MSPLVDSIRLFPLFFVRLVSRFWYGIDGSAFRDRYWVVYWFVRWLGRASISLFPWISSLLPTWFPIEAICLHAYDFCLPPPSLHLNTHACLLSACQESVSILCFIFSLFFNISAESNLSTRFVHPSIYILSKDAQVYDLLVVLID